MPRKYTRKTDWRPQEEREFTIRTDDRETPDYDKLTELLIRLALQQPSEERVS